MESDTSDVSVISKYSVILHEMFLRKVSSFNKDGRNRHKNYCLGLLKSRTIDVGA